MRANFSWTLAGNVLASGCSWAMLVVLAKLGTPETVGRFALGLAVTTPIILFSNLQLRLIQATDTQRKYLFRDYLGLRLVMLALALVITMGIVLFSSFPPELTLVIVIIGSGKAVDAVSDVIYGLLQQHEQMDRISKSMIMKGVLSLVMLSLGQVLTHSLVWAAVGWCLASIIVVVLYDLRSCVTILNNAAAIDDGLSPRFNPSTFARLSWLSLPLGITMLLISLNANVPRYFVAHYSGEQGLGIFAALTALAAAGTTITSALGQSATPRLARYYTAGESRAFQTLLLKLMLLAALLGGVGVFVALIGGPTILTVLYQPEYATHNDVFVWLLVGVGISYFASFCGYGATAAGYFRFQPVIFTICVVSAIIMCVLLIPSQGILGAARAIALTFVIQLVLMALYLARAVHALGDRGPGVSPEGVQV